MVEMYSEHDLGPDFERTVVETVLSDPEFLSKHASLLIPDAFQEEGHRFLIQTLQEYLTKYGTVPDRAIIVELIRRSNYRDRGGLVEFVEGAAEHNGQTYVRDRLLQWARWTSLERVIREYQGQCPQEFVGLLEQASRVGEGTIMEHTQLDKDKSREGVRNRLIRTPWKWLNEQLHGGMEIEDLAVILTVVNGGKTTALVNVAWRALRRGQFVVYFTFEDGEVKIKRRIMQAINGWSLDELIVQRERGRKRRDRFLRKYGGRCEIKDLRTRISTVQDAEAFIRTVEEQSKRKVDVVITDYADRFHPPFRRSEPRHEYREIFEACKAMARNLKVVHWTASQGNKTRTGKEIVSIEHISEAYGKVESADLVLGLGQTMEDERTGRITLFTAKMRDAQKHQRHSLLADFAIQRIIDR